MQHRGQALLEYAIVLAIVSTAVLGMQIFARRSIQGVIKTATDQMSPFANDPKGEKAQIAGIRYESGDEGNTLFPFSSGTVLERKSATTETGSESLQKQTLPLVVVKTDPFTDNQNRVGVLTSVNSVVYGNNYNPGPGTSTFSELVVDVVN